ncbi:NAD(+) diphosphatase [Falsihalocynthiibacter sp. S25ZX9]|uniref:NAD(+) diphosphatase n=1 Tax=Falsihalocynthiibacter sp. S25ZX9 TaxID=3240870 RepID=UPI00350FB934
MKIAETVTFGGSGLDRAAQLRGDATLMQKHLTTGDILPLWRGKVLVQGEARENLARLPQGHPALKDSTGEYIFLGLDDGQAVFACDISSWEPPDQDLELVGQFFDPSEQIHPELAQGVVFAELRSVMAQLSPRDAELVATAKALFNWHDSHGFCAKCGGKSAMTMAGWQRNCTLCDSSHFPRTDPVVIMLITHGNQLLLGRSPGWPEGMYSTLAGFVEPGETLEAAVRREVFEESGIEVGAVTYLASQPWAFPSSLMFGCHGEALNTDITIDPVEIEDAFWISREDLMQVMAGEHPKIRAARRGSIAQFLMTNWLADRLN